MRLASFAALACLATSPARAQVFADFEIKQGQVDFGSFTVLLDHEFAPFTTANFIRLAEGLIPWMDPEKGEFQSGPFYEGLEFYSLTPGFEVAGGSPTNDENGGPGYVIRDDFRNVDPAQPGTKIPDQFALFMDSDGPNTIGSRFFINLASSLNPILRPGQYSRFGQVLIQTNPPGGNGRAVVTAMSQSAPGALSIGKITMRYVGTAALNFRLSIEDPSHPYLSDLPTPRPAVFSFRVTPTSLHLDWDPVPGSIAQLWSTVDLVNWIGPFPVMNVPGAPTFGLDLTDAQKAQPTAFFNGGVIAYPEWPSTERPLAGNRIQTFFFDPAVGTFASTYFFDATGLAGTYSSPFGGGAFEVTDRQVLGPYTSRLELTTTTGAQPTYRLTLHYDLAWSNLIPSIALPRTANPSRLEGENLANPGTPLEGGQWTYFSP